MIHTKNDRSQGAKWNKGDSSWWFILWDAVVLVHDSYMNIKIRLKKGHITLAEI